MSGARSGRSLTTNCGGGAPCGLVRWQWKRYMAWHAVRKCVSRWGYRQRVPMMFALVILERC